MSFFDMTFSRTPLPVFGWLLVTDRHIVPRSRSSCEKGQSRDSPGPFLPYFLVPCSFRQPSQGIPGSAAMMERELARWTWAIRVIQHPVSVFV
jgi:hypothetical protein